MTDVIYLFIFSSTAKSSVLYGIVGGSGHSVTKTEANTTFYGEYVFPLRIFHVYFSSAITGEKILTYRVKEGLEKTLTIACSYFTLRVDLEQTAGLHITVINRTNFPQNTWPRLACLQHIYQVCQEVLSPEYKLK